ncbi:MAG TPA: hypothetical protein ENO25_03745 [Desulfobacteraceae bacterium]|nr:hypothetical protein [Desulfobacteraceae bacterium]
MKCSGCRSKILFLRGSSPA